MSTPTPLDLITGPYLFCVRHFVCDAPSSAASRQPGCRGVPGCSPIRLRVVAPLAIIFTPARRIHIHRHASYCIYHYSSLVYHTSIVDTPPHTHFLNTLFTCPSTPGDRSTISYSHALNSDHIVRIKLTPMPCFPWEPSVLECVKSPMIGSRERIEASANLYARRPVCVYLRNSSYTI